MIELALTTLAGLMAVVLVVAASRRLLLCYAAAVLYRPRSSSAALPRIWIACACRNEERRLPRLIEGLATLPYRGDRKVILIDDGSLDGSLEIMREAERSNSAVFRTIALAAPQRGKAMALREGLTDCPMTDDDILLVVDADHRLAPEALDKLVNYFADPNVAAVAIEHPVDRASRSLISAYCFLEAAVGEAVTSRGQHALGLPTKLAGSWACRPATFRKLYPDGWQLVDDTVFSAAISAEGGQIAYAADVRALQDVPDTLRGYLSQHMRWSAGLAESAAKALDQRRNIESPLAWLDSVATHAGYFERPLMAMIAVVALVGLIVGATLPALVVAFVVAFYVLVIGLQIGVALRLSGADRRLVLMSIASLPLLAVDIAVSIRGIAAGLAGQRIGWTTEHRG